MDGFAMVRGSSAGDMLRGGPDVQLSVPLPARAVLQVAALMRSLPREMDGPAVHPGDFDRELDIDGIEDPLRRDLLHRLRREYVAEYRACLGRKRK